MRHSTAASRRAHASRSKPRKASPARLLLALVARATAFIRRDLLQALKQRFSTWRREIIDALTPAFERIRFEPLEPRLLMSAEAATLLAPPPSGFETSQIVQRTSTNDDTGTGPGAMFASFMAAAAPQVEAEVVVTGAGSAQLTLGDDGRYSLALTGTNASTRVELRTDGNNSHVALSSVQANSAVGTLDLGLGDLQGAARFDGEIGSLTLGNLDAASLQLTGANANLRLGSVHNSSILANQTQLKLETNDWTGSTGRLEAASLTQLNVHGLLDAALAIGAPGATATVLTGVNVEGSVSGVWSISGRTGSVQLGSTAPSWRANFGGAVTQLYIVGDASGLVAASAIQVLQVGGSMRGLTVLVGANLGADVALGGSGANADTFKAGTLARVRVSGDVLNSTILASVDPTTGTMLGGSANRVQELVVGGALGGSSRLVAPAFPATVRVGGQTVAPSTLTQLQTVATDITPPSLSAALRNDTGASSSDGITSDPALLLQAADAGGLFGFEARIGNGNYQAISTTATANGYTVSGAALSALAGGNLADGAYTVALRAIDVAGNRSAAANVAFVLDTTAPTAVVALAPSSDTGTVGDGSTTLASVTLTGKTSAGTLVALNGTQTTADAQGDFTFNNVALNVGSNSFAFTLTDVAGNTGTAGLTVERTAIVGDTTLPVVDTLVLANDTGSSASDGITSNAGLKGTVSDNVGVVQLLVALDTVGTPTFTDFTSSLVNSAFSLSQAQLNSLAGGSLADGPHTVSVVAVDAAGNRSAVKMLSFTLDTLAPTATVSLAPASDTGTVGDGTTTLASVSLQGTTSPGTTVQLGASSATADNQGNFAFNNVALALGSNSFAFSLTDTAGNVGSASLVVQRAAPPDVTLPTIDTLALVADTGNAGNDGITNDARVQGTVSDNVGVTQLLVALDATGSPSFTDVSSSLLNGSFNLSKTQLDSLAGGTLADGAHSLIVVAVDAAGNRSATRTLAFTLDTTAPVATVGLDPSSDTGTLGDNSTTQAVVTLRGNTSPGTLVQLGAASTTANNQGDFAFANLSLNLGANSFNFTLTDAAGNTGTTSLSVVREAIPGDTTAPVVDTLALVNDSGSSATDLLTNDARVQGTVSDNVAVTQLLVALDATGTPTYTDLTSALTGGAFSLTQAQLNTLAGGTLADGAHTLTVVAVDAAGNTSTVKTLTFTLDTTAPTATVSLDAASDTGTAGDNSTTLDTVTLNGTTAAGVVVAVNGQQTTANAQGNFSFNNVALALGSNAFNFTLTDAAGNTGTASLSVVREAIPGDTTAPVVDTLALVNDSGSSATDKLTNDARVQGTVSDNVAVTQLLVALDATGTPTYSDLTSALTGGAFSLTQAQLNTLAGGTLADGAHTLTVVAVDAAGNTSAMKTLSFTLDTSAPGATGLGLAPASDSGTLGDLITDNTSVTLVGQAASGTTVQLGAQQTTADAQGKFSFAGVALAMGSNSFTFTLTDAAGNSSTASLAVQRVAPSGNDTEAPVVATLALLNDSGRSASDGLTNDARIQGTTVDNVGTVKLLVALDAGATPVYTDLSAALANDGSFALSTGQLAALAGGTLADGAHTLRVVAVDAAGNQSAAVSLSFTLDTAAPTGGSFGISQADAVNGDTSQTQSALTVLAGTVEANATVTLGAQGLSVVASGTGVFQLPNVGLATGDNVITLGVVDAAGNSTSLTRTLTRVAPSASVDPVLAWNLVALKSIQLDVSTPEEATRILAIQSIAVYDTLAAIEGTPAYMVKDQASGPTSVEAAVTQAAYRVLYTYYPAQRTLLNAYLAADMSHIADGAAKTAGIALGDRIASAILGIRANDGYRDYTEDDGGTAIGQWRPTGPLYMTAEMPQWGSVTPFALTSADEFRAPPPPELDSPEYAAALEQVRLYGGETSTLRTADQSQMAQFWADGGGSYTPPGHWNLIAEQVATAKGTSLSSNARMMAMLNVALADAAIAAWDTKYTYDFWRPVTAINNADLDNNPGTQVDANWRPLLITPPHPDYVSGHSTFSAAGAGILSSVFGANTAFTTTSVTVLGVTRSFTSFQQAAEEAGMSRIYAGIHTIFANHEGAVIGGKVADAVLARFALTDDTQAPTLVLADSAATTNANLTFTGQIVDNLSGVASAQYRIDNGPLVDMTLSADGKFSVSTALALNGSQDGAHTFTLLARDEAGNLSAGYTRNFTLDTKAPTLALTSIVNGTALDAASRLVGSADATGTSIAQLSYSIDGGTSKTIAFDPLSGAFDQALPLGDLSVGNHTLDVLVQDIAGNSQTFSRAVSVAELAPFSVTKFTPDDGKGDIGSTFRPQVFFSRAVNAATLTADTLYATGPDGTKLAMTIVPALDGSFAWLLPNDPMPGGSTITLHVKGSAIRAAQDGAFLDADGNGVAGGELTWSFTTVSTTSVIGTKLVGRVLDPGPDLLPMTFDDIRRGPDGVIHTPDDVFLNPIAHAKVYIIGQEDRFVYTDALGNFSFDGVPVGNVKLAIDGRTATNAPAGIFFPEMVMDLELKPGIVNTAMGSMGKDESQRENADRSEIYLPRIQTSSLQQVSNTVPTTITVDEKSAPDIIDDWRSALTLTIEPGAAIGFDGKPLTDVKIGINTVPPALVKDMLPPGVLEHTFDITIQAPGVDTFAAPVKITFPNVFNSAPGTKLNILSFDHTTGRLIINGTGTVSADGKTVVSDEGSGVMAPGWHGLTPPGPWGRSDKPRGPNPPPPPPPPPPPGPPPPPPPGPIIIIGPAPTPPVIIVWPPINPIPPSPPPTTTPPPPNQPPVVVVTPPVGGTPTSNTAFNIDAVDLNNVLTSAQRAIVGAAVAQWQSIITTDIPAALTRYGLVDDLRIDIKVAAGDGAGGTLASTQILETRGGALKQPSLAEITLDAADLASATPDQLLATLLHEIGHALGLGQQWAALGLVDTSNPANPRYTGANGVAAYAALTGTAQTGVPLDNRSGATPTHWRESVFGNELMTPLLDTANPSKLSTLTVAALKDLGYIVDTTKAQAYTLPGAGFVFHPGTNAPAHTTDGELLESDGGGVSVAAADTAPTEDTHTSYAFDFGGTASVAPGFTGVSASNAYSAAAGYGWATAGSASDTSSGSNPLTGDLAQTRNGTFRVALANGTYMVNVTLGDDASARDRMSYELEGVRRGAVSTVLGEHITMTHQVEVHDGVLDLRLFGDSDMVAINALEIHKVSDYITPATSVSYTSGHYYFAIQNLDTGLIMRDNTVVAEGGAICPDGVVLSPNTRYRQYVYHVETNTIGISDYVTPKSGNDFDLPEVVLGNRYTPDTDVDGLEDLAEFIIGTRADKKDTDADGISDLAEVQQQLDPLGGLSIPTGVVSNAALQGSAQAVAVIGTGGDTGAKLYAYVATGTYGLAVVDVSQTTRPTLRAELDLPGVNVDVAVDAVRGLALVAAGDAGLHIVNISNPAAPALQQTLLFDAAVQNVRVRDGLGFVAAGSNLSVVDLNTGDILQTLNLQNTGGGIITSLSIDGGTLYTLDNQHTLRSFAINGTQLAALDTLAVSTDGDKIFAGGGIVYVGTANQNSQGFLSVDATNPANLLLKSGVDLNSTAGQAMAANGSGLLVTTGELRGPVGQQLFVLDVSDVRDPANTGSFVTRYLLPNAPMNVAIANGLAFVADGTGGLQIVNYIGFDAAGTPPTVTIAVDGVDVDPTKPGIQVLEGRTVQIRPTVSDDVQVRNVELLVNGVVVSNAAAFPFELFTQAPTIASAGNTLTLQIRATDTGGNSTLSTVAVLDVVPDTFAPEVESISVAEGARRFFVRSIDIQFDEPLDVSLLNVSGVSLVRAGNDGVFGTADDVAITTHLDTRAFGQSLSVLPDSFLTAGDYQLVIAKNIIADRSGNTLDAPIVRHFTVRPASGVQAASGVADVQQAPSANVGQEIGINVPFDPSTARAQFVTIDASGTKSSTVVNARRYDAASGVAYFTVPLNATSGDLVVYGQVGNVRTDFADGTLPLQIVPIVTDVQVQSISADGSSAVIVLSGYGFAEGVGGEYRIGSEVVNDVSNTTGPDVQDRYDPNLGYYIANGQVTLTVPLSNAAFGAISVKTAGGTSALFSVSLSSITSVAASGTPANAALASANAGQAIVLNGTGLSTATDVLLRYTNQSGVLSMVRLNPTTAASDGSSATLVLPAYANGAFALQVFGSASQPVLQIVPTLTQFSESGNLYLIGSGYVEGATTITLPGKTVVDTLVNAGVDITYGAPNYIENTYLTLDTGDAPRYGLGNTTVTTAGGTSAALALNTLRVGSDTTPAGYLSDIAVDPATGATWVLDNANPDHLLRINTATGAVLQTITLSAAYGPQSTAQGYAGLQVTPAAFSLNGTNVPQGSLLLFNGYTSNHVAAINPTTGAAIALLTLPGSYMTSGVFDPTSGHLFVTNATNGDNKVSEFTTGGVLVNSFALPFAVTGHTGMAIDPATGNLWIGSSASGTNIVLFSRSGSEIRRVDLASQGVAANTISGLAFGADGALRVSSTQGVVRVLNLAPDLSVHTPTLTSITSLATDGVAAQAGVASANVGQVVTLTGSNFGAGTRVLFEVRDNDGNTRTLAMAPLVINATGTSLQVQVPDLATTGNVRVVNASTLELAGRTDYPDSIYRNVTLSFTAGAATATVRFADGGLEGVGNESWGLDNVRVRQGGTTLFSDDFEGAAQNQWSLADEDSASLGSLTRYSGRFSNSTQTLNLTGLTAGQTYTLNFDLYILDSWDGSHPTAGPDLIDVSVDGTSLLHATFANGDYSNNSQAVQTFGTSAGVRLQVVPTLTDISGRPGEDGLFTLIGSGFMEGASTLTIGGVSIADTASNLTPFDVTGTRNSSLTAVAPRTLDGPIRITTEGGYVVFNPVTPAQPVVQFSALVALASSGTPVDAAVASANPGQTIVLQGQGFTSTTLVQFRGYDDTGTSGTLLRTGTVSNNGQTLTVVVPALATTGPLTVLGSSTSFALQIAPAIRGVGGALTPGNTVMLQGIGFSAPDLVITVGGRPVGNFSLRTLVDGSGQSQDMQFITLTVPTGAVGNIITVSTGGGSSLARVGQAITNLGTVTPVADPGDTLASATNLGDLRNARVVVNANIGDGANGAKDVDLYKVQLASGLLRVNLSSSAMYGLVRVFDASGTQVASRNFNLNDSSTLDFTLDFGGTYTIGVSGYYNSTYNPTVANSGADSYTGTYSLSIEEQRSDSGRLSSIDATAASGTPAQASIASANTGQIIVLHGLGISSSDRVIFTVIDDSGNIANLTVAPTSIDVTAQTITVTVPDNTITGRVRLERDPRVGLLLQIVPTLTDVAMNVNQSFAGTNLALTGSGFAEGATSVLFGNQRVDDIARNYGLDVYTRYDATLGRYITNGGLNLTVPSNVPTGPIRISTIGGTSAAFGLTLSSITTSATSGTPTASGQASAQPLQAITLVGVGLDASTDVVFQTMASNGQTSDVIVHPTTVNAAGTQAQVVVPYNAITGQVRVVGDTNGASVPLQIVPAITDVQVQSVAADGSSAVVVLSGYGFIEGGNGNSSSYLFGSTLVLDAGASTGPDVQDRYDPNLGYYIANGQVTLTVPLSNAAFGAISVKTAGGTSALFSVSLSSITSVAASGTPANAALASANAGQAIVLNGTGLSTATDVLLRYTNQSGVLSMVRLNPTTAASDGSSATLVLPAYANGAFALQVFGSASQPVLQIVPTLTQFSESGNLYLIGSGYVEGATTITLPGKTVVDTLVNAGVDITYGAPNYIENTYLTLDTGDAPRYGLGNTTVTTAGGTSAALALNTLRVGSDTTPAGYLSDIAVDPATGATWVLDNANPDHLLRINTATGAVLQTITLSAAYGPQSTAQGYAGLQVTPAAFSLNGTNVPQGSLLLFNGYTSNHVAAINPTTGAAIALLTLPGSYMTSGVFDPTSGHLFVTNATNGDNKVSEFTTGGVLVNSFALPFAVTGHTGMAIDPATGNLWIGSSASGTNIVLFSRSGSEIRRVDLASQGVAANTISGLAFGADGALRVSSTQGVVRVLNLAPDLSVHTPTLTSITSLATDGVAAQAGVASANVGQVVTLTGSNFGAGTRVLFEVRDNDGNTRTLAMAPLVINATGTSLQVQVPDLATTGNVRVVNASTLELAGRTDYPDSIYRNVTLSFTAGAATATVRFADGGLEGVGNESWGLDNVRVRQGGTTLFSDDFEGAAQNQWSLADEDSASLGSLTRYSGRFSNSTQTLNLTGLTAGQTYTLNFDLYILDSWDGSHPTAGPDLIDVSVDGTSLLHATFANGDYSNNSQAVQTFGTSAGVRLQVVPTLTDISGRPGEDGLFTLIGSGFMEGASTLTIGGVSIADTASNLTPFDVTGTRNSSLTAVAPRTLDGPIRITTEGGYVVFNPVTPAQPVVQFSALVAPLSLLVTDANSTPADPSQPASSTGVLQIVLQGQGFTSSTLVQFQGRDDGGVSGTLTRTGTVSNGGRTLSLTVPAIATSGAVTVLGSGTSFNLQIVPVIRALGGALTPGNTIVLDGYGLSASDLVLTVGGKTVSSYSLRTVSDGTDGVRDIQFITLTVPQGAVGNVITATTSGGTSTLRVANGFAYLGIQNPANDPGDTLATALDLGAPRDARLAVDSTIGTVNAKDVDQYKIDLAYGNMLRVNLTSTTLYGLIRIFDASGQEVATRNYSVNDGNYLQFQAPASGIYTIGVSGYYNNAYNPSVANSGADSYVGDYRLNMEVRRTSSTRLSSIDAVAASGTPAQAGIASANTAQSIVLHGLNLASNDLVTFTVSDDNGNSTNLTVTPTSIDVAAQTITVVVPDNATTGRVRINGDWAGLILQIVPTLTDVAMNVNQSFAGTNLALTGSGFAEGATSVLFGNQRVDDIARNYGLDVYTRYDATLGRYITNGGLNLTVPSNVPTGPIRISTIGGTSAAFGLTLSSITTSATSGTPTASGQASAQPLQAITLVGVGLDASTDVVFQTMASNGQTSDVIVHPTTVNAAGTQAQVVVPYNAITGQVRVVGDTNGASVPLQIVPAITDVQVQSVAADGSSAVVVLSGYGFIEGGNGNSSSYLFGSTLVLDAGASTGPDVQDRYDPNLGYYIANGQVTLTVPLSNAAFGAISVKTAGGTSALFSVSLSSITSVAASGTPANAALASANAGQAIVLNGTGLSTATDVLLRYTNQSGVLSMVRLNPTTAASDGSSATLVLPAYANGAFALQVFGSASQPVLQIVPTLTQFSESGNLYLIGSGYVEGATTITLPGKTVVDTLVNAGVDITYGAPNYIENTYLTLDTGDAPRYGLGNTTVTTAGGTSAALALNTLRVGSDTTPAGYLSDIAVDPATGATWVLDNANPDHLLRINTATGAVLQTITLSAAYGPQSTAQGYAGLQVTPAAFSLNGTNVPQGSLLLFNGYTSNHVAAINPTTGAAIALLTLPGSYMTAGVFDPTSGHLYVTTNDNKLSEFTTAGVLVNSFAVPLNVTSGTGLAIDPVTGNLWLGSYYGGSNVVLINRNGTEIRRVDLSSQGVSGNVIAGLAFGADGQLRVSTANGTVHVVSVA